LPYFFIVFEELKEVKIMDWMSMLKQIWELCIVPLLGILTVYVVNYIKAKNEELK
jgi:hypothetical protein